MGCLLLLWASVELEVGWVCHGNLGGDWSKFSFWSNCLSSLHTVRSAYIQICLWEWGSKLTILHGCLDGHSYPVLYFQKCFHFLYDGGVWTYVVCPWHKSGYLLGSIPFVQVGPLHGCNFDFHIYHLYGEFALKESVQEIALRLKLASHFCL